MAENGGLPPGLSWFWRLPPTPQTDGSLLLALHPPGWPKFPIAIYSCHKHTTVMRFILLLASMLAATATGFIYRAAQADQIGTATNSWGIANGVWNASNTVTVTTTSALALAANPNRAYLYIQNTGTTTVSVRLGSVQTGTEGIQIAAGGVWAPVIPPINSLYMVSASSTDSVTIVEGIR